MSNPTSSIQLLGGLLSMAPSNGANGLLSQNNLRAAPPSEAFYSLWVGLTQSAPLDTALANVERQASGNVSQSDGSILPLEISTDLLKQIENLLEDGSDSSEALDNALNRVRESLRNLFSQIDNDADTNQSAISKDDKVNQLSQLNLSNNTLSIELPNSLELSDKQLLAYLQIMQTQLTQKQEIFKYSRIIHQKSAEGEAANISILTQYLEQKLALSPEGKASETGVLTDVDQENAEQRMNQLWLQLETARRLREAEDSKLISSSSTADKTLLTQSQLKDSVNESPRNDVKENELSLPNISGKALPRELADSLELSDEQLLAYLQLIQQQLTRQQQTPKDSGIVNQSTTEDQTAIISILTQYLEQKLALSPEGKASETGVLTDADQENAEQRMNQLWLQLEAARRVREVEDARLASSNSADSTLQTQSPLTDSDNESLVPRPQETIVAGKTNEKTDDLDTLQKEALVRDELYRKTLAQLIQEQNRAVVTDPQAQPNAATSERSVSPPIAPINPLSQLNNDKAADRALEPRIVLTPSAAVSGMPSSDLTPAERLAASEVMQEMGRRALTEAISQANAQRNAVDDVSSDSLRRQEASATSATLIADAQKMVQSPASPAQTPIAQANNSQDALMQKMLNPAWSRALGERAVMMAQQGPRLAEVRLDPPELGALRIRVQVHGNDQVSLTFNAPNASVREVLEQSLPRLREMFAEQGMNLADASVSDQSREQNSEQAHARESGRGDASAREEFGELPANRTELRKVGIIDYYA